MIRAIGIGDNVCDKYRHLGMMFPGGQALNFAVYCRQKGNEAAYLGAFGSDAVAEHVIATLTGLGIDISHSRHYNGENGYAVIDIRNGDRVFVASNKGGVLRTHPPVFDEEDLRYIASFDIIHTSNNSYIDAQLPKLAELDKRISYDFSGSWKDEERTRTVCRYIHFGFLSCTELSDEAIGRQLEKMHGWGCGIAVGTIGSRGAVMYDGERCYSVRPKPVDAIDTLGAGDSFAAGFLMNFADQTKNGVPEKGSVQYQVLVRTAMEAGAALAAETCMTQGAFGYGTGLI